MINYVVCVVSQTCFDENQYLNKQKEKIRNNEAISKLRRTA